MANVQRRAYSSTDSIQISVLDKYADFEAACRFAESMDSRIPTLFEFSRTLILDPASYCQTGSWYWIGDPLNKDISGHCRLNPKTKAIEKVSETEYAGLPNSQKVLVSSSGGPAVLWVGPHDDYKCLYVKCDHLYSSRIALVPLPISAREREALSRLRRAISK